MWPGVPVLACATMRPRRSNSAHARSPASRTTGLNAIRCKALARSVTMPIRLDHRISSSTPSIALFPPREDAADRVDHRRPVRRYDGRGFTLFDDRRSLDTLPGRQHATIVDGSQQAIAPGVNFPPALRRAGCRRQCRRLSERNEGTTRRHPPRHHLDRDMERIDAVQLLVGPFEHIDDALGIVVVARIGVERYRQLALLAGVAQVGRKDEHHAVLAATGLAQRRRRLASKLAQDAID